MRIRMYMDDGAGNTWDIYDDEVPEFPVGNDTYRLQGASGRVALNTFPVNTPCYFMLMDNDFLNRPVRLQPGFFTGPIGEFNSAQILAGNIGVPLLGGLVPAPITAGTLYIVSRNYNIEEAIDTPAPPDPTPEEDPVVPPSPIASPGAIRIRWEDDGERWSNWHEFHPRTAEKDIFLGTIKRMGQYRYRKYQIEITKEARVIICSAEELLEALTDDRK